MFISTTAAYKSGQEICPLVLLEFIKPLVLDPNTSQESPPSIKAPNLLLHRWRGDTVVLVEERPRETSHEVISVGRGDMTKFGGVCSG